MNTNKLQCRIMVGVGVIMMFLCAMELSAATYYVSLSGSNNNNGTTTTTTWRTITHAATEAVAGDTVYIKAGNYGEEYVMMENSGTSGSPIRFIGCDGNWGTNISLDFYDPGAIENDDYSNTAANNTSIDSSEMPLLSGNFIGFGIHIRGAYIEIKNLQIRNYYCGIFSGMYDYAEDYNDFLIVDNCIIDNCHDPEEEYTNSGYCLILGNSTGSIIRNSIFTDANMANLVISDNCQYTLVDNCKSYGVRGPYTIGVNYPNNLRTDYFISLGFGVNNSTVKNCLVENVLTGLNTASGQHGISLKNAESCKIIDCEVKNFPGRGYEVSRGDSAYNEFINCTAYTDSNLDQMGTFCYTAGGGHGNKFINCTGRNLLRWCIMYYVIGYEGGTGEPYDNAFINCNLIDIMYIFKFSDMSSANVATHRFVNCIFENIDIYGYASASYPLPATYSCYNNSGSTVNTKLAVHASNFSADPLFADSENLDFHLKSEYGRWSGSWENDAVTSPCIDAGNPTYDYLNEPMSGGRVNIGAYGNTEYASMSLTAGSNIIATWKFDESSGSTAEDFSDNSNDGTLSAGMSPYNDCWVNGKFGKALEFDGVDDYVNCGNDASLNVGAIDSVSWDIWFKTNATANYPYLMIRLSGSNYIGLYIRANGQVRFILDDGPNSVSVSSGAGYNDGLWHHAVAVRDVGNDELRIYVDGVASTPITDTTTGTIIDAGDLLIGKYNSNTLFNGTIDEVKIYEPPARAYWKFDESSGSTAEDSSGHGNDGTLSAGMSPYNDCWVNGKFGKALEFDGVDDYINCGNDASLNVGAIDSVSWDIWFKTNATANYPYLMIRLSGSNYIGLYVRANGQVRFILDDGSNNVSVSSGTGYNDGLWHHAVAVRDVANDELRIYVDGVASTPITDTTTETIIDAGDLLIGKYSNTLFNGMIDEVRIYGAP